MLDGVFEVGAAELVWKEAWGWKSYWRVVLWETEKTEGEEVLVAGIFISLEEP